jgi:hypothetical protein
VPLAKSPAVEDEVVLGYLGKRHVERTSRGGRQNDIVKRPARRVALDCSPCAGAEEAGERDGRHPSR